MRPHGKYANVNPNNPEAFGQCDRCSFWYQLNDLVWDQQWAGTHLYRTGALVCTRCNDIPSEQLRTIILPSDPAPVLNARTTNLAYEEQTVRITQYAGPNEPPWGSGPQMIRCTQAGETARVLQYVHHNSTGFAMLTISPPPRAPDEFRLDVSILDGSDVLG